ncbi:MAG TPA: DoxX family protein [Candidatus Angelobacter sp.]|jgi:uncharacterized membrane protein YphA (DoxX/SURF4 family)|nr:DoxX family protein [Candidatus Angelobacter sp.]
MADSVQTGVAVASSIQSEPQGAIESVSSEPVAQWNLGLRIAFRFCFAYFTLYCLSTQIVPGMIAIPKVRIPSLGTIWPLHHLSLWTAAHVFHISGPLVTNITGSGDRVFDWVENFCVLSLAVVAVVIWSIVDRRRKNYIALHKWFRLFVRFALACQLLGYGFAKVIPLQMPFPPFYRLLEPFGNFSPMGVLWSSIGASRPYEIFVGSAEALAGILLILPRTSMLGALVALADMIEVFTLNMTYDVPVKLLSFHLILLSLFLLAPDVRRLASFLFSNHATGPSTQPALFRRLRANRIALILQAVFGLYVIFLNIYQGIESWHTRGGARPKPSLYGIWNVEEMSIDGQIRSPLLTDSERWRRVLFDFTTAVQLQRADDSFMGCSSSINDKDKTLSLTKPSDKNWKASFTFDRQASDQLILDGAMDGHKIHMKLKRLDHEKLMLVNRGFHWINDYPFQR